MSNQMVSFISFERTGVMMLMAVGIGVLQLLWGFKFRKLWITLQGFLLGFMAGGLLGGLLGDGMAAILIVPFVCAVLGAFIAYRFFKVGIFICCFGGVFLLIKMAGWTSQMIGGEGISVWVALLLGVIAGALGVTLTKPVFIIMTAIAGGSSIGSVVGGLTGLSFVGILLGFILIGVGIWYQIKNTGGLFERKHAGDKSETESKTVS